jgi:drug/metabolite transporter (DMT)-like permease
VTPASLFRLLSLALIWGSSFLWIKLGLDALSPGQMVFARVALGAMVLCAIALVRRTALPTGGRMWGHLLVYVFFANVLPFTLFAIGEQTVDSGLTGVINSTTPLWAVPCTLLFGGVRRIGLNTIIGLVIGFTGILLIFSPWQATGINLGGAAICLVAAASYGVGVVYAGRFLANKGVAPGGLAAAQMLAATVMAALVLPFDGLQPIRWDVPALLAVVVLGVFGTGFAFLIQHAQIAKEGPTAASMVAYLLPVVSVLLGVLFLHEALTIREVAGMVIVLAGVGLTKRKAKVVAPAPVEKLESVPSTIR